MQIDDQLPLFDTPPRDVIAPKMRRPPSTPARYAKCRPKRRTLCDDCIRDIHDRGPAVAPHPRVVTWRRVDNRTGEISLLCDAHKRYRKGES